MRHRPSDDERHVIDMKTVLFQTTESRDAGQTWLPHWERATLRTLLRSAAERARGAGHTIVASVTRAIPRPDLVDVFASARTIAGGTCFYWEQPAQSVVSVGIGSAAALTADGGASVADVAAQWQALLRDAVIAAMPDVSATAYTGPLCFGGFAFDPLAPRTSLWEGFPDGLLVLPELLISSSAAGTTLTANLLIAPEDDDATLEHHADSLDLRLLRLRAAVERHEREPRAAVSATHLAPLHDLRPAAEWMSLVGEVSQAIRGGVYQKVVLARGVEASAEPTVDVRHALRHLRASYPTASIFALQQKGSCFLGATPERLARVEDGRVLTMALAGTTRRGTSNAEDRIIGDALLRSPKNRHEHAIVVETVRKGIAPLVSDMNLPQMPNLLQLANLQHLQTPITGTLLPGKTILDVVAALHPTPAVGGFPRDKALAVIREREQLDRGWFAGPIGWVGPKGEGEFAVALRSGLVTDSHATLFAGCGIMGDSEPQREYEETCLKLQVMLDALRGES